ncbi:hypothetical protein BT93_B0669 [Corymbia citriodora subsp. variegata]|nr:hypothetical protein BT93_B0669 [Corymbia citriodora subsp. variegata]
MEGSSSAPRLLNLFPLHPSSPGSSSSSCSPIQNASMVTPQERELPAKDNVAMAPPLLNLFPLRPSGPGSSSSSSPIQNANVVTPQEGEFPEKGPKRKRSSGVSTDLVLYDLWKIEKQLTESDIGHLSRLMLPLDLLEAYVFPFMSKEMVTQVQSKEGMNVVVEDEDTREEHQLVFRRWKSSPSYVLNNGWAKQFVKRRGLKVRDKIGMFWNKVNHKFHFKVL